MGMFDKLKNKVTNNNDYNEGYDDDYYGGFDQPYDDQPVQQQAEQNMGYDQPAYGGMGQSMGSAPMGNPAPVSGAAGMALSGSAIELKVVKPTEFKNASQIADHLLNRRTVVLNLEATDKENARRLIDFLTGRCLLHRWADQARGQQRLCHYAQQCGYQRRPDAPSTAVSASAPTPAVE